MSVNMAEFSRSPLNMLSSYMGGEGDDTKAMKQAFYNTAATLFVVFAGFAAISVYYILEAFIRPLLWAVLCGTFLHPFKSTLTTILRSWLKNLRQSGTPLLVGTALIPVKIVDTTAENLSSFFMRHVKLILGGTVALLFLNMMYYFGPLQQIFTVLKAIFYFLYDALGYFNAIWVWTLVVAYAVVVLMFWSPASSVILRPLSIPVWLALVFHLATIAGVFRVPLLMLVIVTIIFGFVSEVNEARKLQRELGRDASSPSAIAIWNVWSSSNQYRPDLNDSTDQDTLLSTTEPPTETLSASAVDRLSMTAEAQSNETVQMEKESVKNESRPTELNLGSGQNESGSRGEDCDRSPSQDQPKSNKRSLVDMCFIGLLWALILVRLWINIWVINLLPIFFICLIIKKFGTSLGSWVWLREHFSAMVRRLTDTVKCDARVDLLAPRPIRGVGKLLLHGDRKIIASLERSLDKTVTILMVLLVIFGSIMGAVFMAVQVHRESMHMVSVTSNVLNKSLHPELTHWLPDQDVMQKHMDNMVGNAYLYGREWITDKLHSVLNGDDVQKSDVQKQVLDVWDRVYEKWFARTNKSAVKPTPALVGRQMSLDFSNISSVWDLVSFSNNFNLDLMDFATENYGTFMQVVDSVWGVLKGNLSLVLSVLTATLSLLLGGGTAILNFVLSTMVFLTTLFYLLASSGDQYKPMQWIAGFNPSRGGAANKFGIAVEQAISSVFLASLKMASFYGLYTWLTHTVFGIQIVFIPSALAAIFAAIPFLGTYFAALPAVIELWLVNGQKVQALLLIGCHLLPMFFVDTAIYSEVKGGHPYLTGLAIAGGMYWLGLEGAIIGPILLCCLIVAMNVYSTMLEPEKGTPDSVDPMHRSKKVTFNIKRGFTNID